MGRWSAAGELVRGAASRIGRLAEARHRGRRIALLSAHLAWILAESRRIALRNEEAAVVSWPKSGRTWLRLMLDELGIHLDYTHQREADPLPRGWENKRIVFLHRDPRDASVSQYFAVTRRGWGYRGSLPELLRDPELGLERAMRFNLFWKERLDRAGGGLILTYEGLHADAAGEIARVLDFLGGPPVTEAAVARAVAAGGFEAMRALERSGRGARLYGDALTPGDPADPDSFKTREGRVGGWRNHFSEADTAFADALLERHDYVRRMRPSAERPTAPAGQVPRAERDRDRSGGEQARGIEDRQR
jgi:hypothetical protein